ncbi:MAG TPA: glycoside hydrolase family 97 N-terminal domain-containing protein, partial [Paludibacter sp.]|nr:glycoside hydrolase family 97 N-terminal domain-containing protein [Paludibacter sp.]
MKKISILCLVLVFAVNLAKADDKKISSPDGKLEVTVSINAGVPFYSVSYNGKVFLKPSPIGVNTNVGDFTKDITHGDTIGFKKIDDTYSLPNIKKSKVHYQANEGVFKFSKNGKPAFDAIFRISNNDVAFRYKVYPQKDRLSCVVNEESTGFVFPAGTTTFLCPQSKTMVGFARTMPSYETSYTTDVPMGQNGHDNNGFTFPCLFKVGAQGWVLISETGVDSRYCGSRLMGRADGLYTIGFPMVGENNGNGTASPGIALPGFTPWRTITVGETLAPIVETTVAFDVVEPLYVASQ